MTATDPMRTIKTAKALDNTRLALAWSDGQRATLDLKGWLAKPSFAALANPDLFAQVELGDWGHSLEWPNGVEISADALWLETLSETKNAGARRFLEWRLKHGLSLSGAADALGLSRRMVAYYSNAEKPVPLTVELACKGWEAGRKSRRGSGPSAAGPRQTTTA